MNGMRKVWAIGSLAAIGLALLVGAAVLLSARLPEAETLLRANPVPFIVTIISPANNSQWPLNAPVSVRFSVSSRTPLSAIELWSDGVLLDSGSPPDGSDPARTFRDWSWTAGREGDHDLLLRVRTADGRAGTSNLVHIVATAPAAPRRLVIARAGDTLADLARAEGTAAEIRRANPARAADAPLAAGQPVDLLSFWARYTLTHLDIDLKQVWSRKRGAQGGVL